MIILYGVVATIIWIGIGLLGLYIIHKRCYKIANGELLLAFTGLFVWIGVMTLYLEGLSKYHIVEKLFGQGKE